MTDIYGGVYTNAVIELDPFGGETSAMANGSGKQSHVFTSYERDAIGGMDEAGARKYHGWWSRFDQPDPYDGSYNLGDPQSFNRYAYVQNDPVNLVDPSGLLMPTPHPFFRLPDFNLLGLYNRYRTHYVIEDRASERGDRNTTPPQTPSPTPPQVSSECQSALNDINKDAFAIQRAYESKDILNEAGNSHILSPKLLAAIGVRESGFQNIPQQRGKAGRGTFQIDLGQHKDITEAQALDPTVSANYAANLLSNSIISYLKQGYSADASIMAEIRNYNGHSPTTEGTSKILKRGGGVSDFDSGTTGGNYVSNVMAIWNNCFPH